MLWVDALVDAIRNTFNLSGRTNRNGFLLFAQIYLIGLYALSWAGQSHNAFRYFYWIYFVFLGVPFISLSIRRLHDLSLSAWWSIPVYLYVLQEHTSRETLAWLVMMRTDLYAVSSFSSFSSFFSLFRLVKYALFLFLLFLLCRKGAKENPYAPKPLGVFTTLGDVRGHGSSAGILLATAFLTGGSLWAVSGGWARPPRLKDVIVNYRPENFQETADRPFFYSVDGNLKYGVSIDRDAPTLLKGKDKGEGKLWVWPSPDNRKAAVFSENRLYLAREHQPLMLLLEKAEFSKDLAVGEDYYKSGYLQWDEASRYLYVPRDKKQSDTQWSKWFSKDAVLMRIDTENPSNPEIWIREFRSSNYFLVGDENICFNYLRDDRKEQWKCSVREKTVDMASYSPREIVLANGKRLTERQFVFNKLANGPVGLDLWRESNGLIMKPIEGGMTGLFLGHQSKAPLLKMKTYRKMKIAKNKYYYEYNGEYWLGSGALPGKRYAFLVMLDNNILLDCETGKYREIPKDTKVFVNTTNLAGPDLQLTPDFFPWGKNLPKGEAENL
ncbi:MAG: DUF805 domain-containing protein [Candidatus Accumulibacter sp.]|jgi:uncharacterized membrane protein YhaH (DUF805 family)|nr:DUF805 domain-containing protein [Accumulibacter sp.]